MTVYLVGAGPGDPGLLTVRGAEVLGRADVVVYDRLSVASLLQLAPDSAELISVGKAPGRVEMTQTDINELLVERGKAGECVVRLKGGDPFVFARGGEEAAALLEAGVPFEVVPGITSAIAAPAYAGIPLTLRHSSTSFTVVTGHEDPSVGADGSVDWDALGRVGGTIVVLMGVARIRQIADRLLASGRAPETPVAAVTWGTRPEQRTVRATLATIADQPIDPPATIVIGDVAALDLAWFERRPLFGRRVVVTRAKAQAAVLTSRLEEMGAEVIELPVISIDDPDDGGEALRRLASRVRTYDWVVVTSANGAPPAPCRRCVMRVISPACVWPRSGRALPKPCPRAMCALTSSRTISSRRHCSPTFHRPPMTALGVCCWRVPRSLETCCQTDCGRADGTSTS